MFNKSKTIATISTELFNSEIRIMTELEELKKSNQSVFKTKELKKELDTVKEGIEFLRNKIENAVYQITKTNDLASIMLFDYFIIIFGLRFVKGTELEKIAKFLGHDYYGVQSIDVDDRLIIYFCNDEKSLKSGVYE